jgi:hypothetical protein
VLGRLVKRGLDDELKSTAYAIIAGVDGRTHHVGFTDLELTGDAPLGAIVEARVYDDANGRQRMSLTIRSDLSIEAQVTAVGATWLDRQLLTKDASVSEGGFGAEVRKAMNARIDFLASEGLAHRQAQGVTFARDLLATLRRREIEEAAAKLAAETGLAHQPSAEGDHLAGIYRRRVTLASGRFAMIDNVSASSSCRGALRLKRTSAARSGASSRRVARSTGTSAASADSASDRRRGLSDYCASTSGPLMPRNRGLRLPLPCC